MIGNDNSNKKQTPPGNFNHICWQTCLKYSWSFLGVLNGTMRNYTSGQMIIKRPKTATPNDTKLQKWSLPIMTFNLGFGMIQICADYSYLTHPKNLYGLASFAFFRRGNYDYPNRQRRMVYSCQIWGIILPRSPLKFPRVDFVQSIHVGRLLVPKKKLFLFHLNPGYSNTSKPVRCFSFGLFFGIQKIPHPCEAISGGMSDVPCNTYPLLSGRSLELAAC